MACFNIIPGHKIGKDQPCFIIAEIGQNHQGEINIAQELIKVAKACGADCVKFQKSDLQSRFNKVALSRPYESLNSWGDTYGEHRRHLEFSKEEFVSLQNYASSIGIPFTASGMDKVSIDFLSQIQVPFFKIGSGDANNFPLLTYTAKLGRPLVISTGMQDMSVVSEMYRTLRVLNENMAILHCTSSYPCPPQHVNLNVIQTYIKEFPESVIGYSGHEVGIGISIAAVALGAKVLERHLTFDHNLKGSDHMASLIPQEFNQLVSEVRAVELAFGSYKKFVQPSEMKCYEKLAKTIVAAKPLLAGTCLTEDMLDIKVAEPKGWKAEKMKDLLGRKIKHDILSDCSILEENVL